MSTGKSLEHIKLVVADLSWKACVCKGLCPLHGIMETYFYAYALCKYKCYARKAFLRFKDCWKYSEGGGVIHRVITYLHIQVPYTLDASALSNLSLDYWASGHHHNLMNVCDFVCYNLILDRLAHS